MVKYKCDDIEKTYDFNTLDGIYFPTKEIVKGSLWWKKTVKVPDRLGGREQVRVDLTNKVLSSIGTILNKDIKLKDNKAEEINQENLSNYISHLNKDKLEREKNKLFLIDNQDNLLGFIDYSFGIKRSYVDPDVDFVNIITDVGGGMKIVIKGESIENSKQFGNLEQQLSF